MNTLINSVNRSVLLDVLGSVEDELWTPLQDVVQTSCADKVLTTIHLGTWEVVITAVWNFHQDFIA